MPRGRPKKVTTEETKPTTNVVEKTPVSKKQKYVFGLGRRKSAIARVFLYEEKNGQITVNGKPFEEYFRGTFHGTPHLEPFKVTSTEGQYRVDVRVEGSGKSGQLDAIILGISRALELIDKEKNRPLLKKRGLLTRDSRIRERRKVGTGGRARRQKQSPKR
jgi:small subunit ribosomal protein S9